MKRSYRLALATLTAAGSVALVIGLVLAGTASEGPISATMESVGGWVSGLENRLVTRFRGPGRSEKLSWLEPLRADADSLRHPDTLLLGAYDSRTPTTLEGLVELEEALDVTFALMHHYIAWGDESEHGFPRRFVQAVDRLGSIPVITWEPWLTTFENRLHPELPLRAQRDEDGLRDVAAGAYDFYIREWAGEAAEFGRPIMIRFAHEMNDPYRYPWGPQNNEPQHFIAAWRHVVDLFREAGADNVVWVWSPHVAYEGYEVYWPGDEYVDWVGTAALNYGTVAYWSQWWSFEQIFGQHYDFLAGFGKPIMVAEFGTIEVGGERADWYREALARVRREYTEVQGLIFFHVESDATVTRQTLDWTILGDSALVRAVREGLGVAGERAAEAASPESESP